MNVASLTPGRLAWENFLIWGLLLLALYGLRDVFFIAFLTFLLSYLIRAIVVFLARRLHSNGENPGLERWLTLAACAGIVAVLWGLMNLIGPQLVLQSRLLMTSAQRQDPEQMLNHVLGRTIGAYLFGQTYGAPGDPRYQAALQQFESDGQLGEGAFAGFGHLQSDVQSQFEIAYERAEQQRLRDQVVRGGADSRRFEDEWRKLQSSPAYLQAFRNWFEGQRGQDSTIPYDFNTYIALRDAYPEGMAAFNQVYQARVAASADMASLLQSDFQRAAERDLARKWWAASPAAASIREHLRKEPAQFAAALAGRVEGFMSSLIAIPAQVATALLLTILITFDMAKLKQGALRLRQTRIAPLYDRVVPNLVAVARLIGRSFAAQGLIAVFNALLTFVLLQILDLHNELLLCAIVFIASFIPVLGVILSGIPITLQALLQPDGSLALALYALLGIAVIHAIEATVLSPKIVGKILHLHPVLVMAVLIVGEHLFGIWGLLLGVPVAVFIIHAGILGEAIPGVYEPPKRASAD